MLLPLIFSMTSLALPPIQHTLDRLKADPESFRHQLPEKSPLPTLEAHFQVTGAEEKRHFRDFYLTENDKEAPRSNDRAEHLVDNASTMERSLLKMQQRGLLKAQLKDTPWSDSYWPLYQGALGARYQDSFFFYESDWKKLFDYTQKESKAKLLSEGRAAELSPSEKYDLLMGDSQGTLTKKMWSEGEIYYQRSGNVETWMGLCHGWAAASFMLPSPQKEIMVSDPQGIHQFPLYVSDIKALGTLLYSNARFPTRFIGSRCNDQAPTEEHGRPTNPDCRDTNSGTWHLSVVNQIGLSRRSFILDATYDYQVWNQPVVSYEYSYFVPQTKRLAPTLEEGRMLKQDFHDDSWAHRRAARTKWIVGIVMDVTYVIENSASVDNAIRPRTRTVRYTYDLELDEKSQIIGGEWYNNSHPDFLWVPEENVQPASYGIEHFANWEPGHELTAEAEELLRAYSQRGIPVGKVVDELFGLSH